MPINSNAIQRMVRGPDGKMKSVYFDSTTGQQLSDNLNGYPVTDGYTSNLRELGLDPLQSSTPEVDKPISSQVIEDVFPSKKTDHEPGDRNGLGRKADVTNNFGYISKPGWMDYASFAPGMIGMAAKGANLGVNANNVSATNEAREMLGLDDLGAKDTIKGLARGTKGQVADVGINNQNYSVGFEAMTPDDRTNLTPNEALTRANLLGGLTEEPNPAKKDTGLFSGIFDEAQSFFDSIFSDEPKDKTDYTGTDKFPGRPAPAYSAANPESYDSPIELSGIGRGSGSGSDSDRTYDGKSYSGENKGLDSPSEGKGRFGGSGLGSPSESESKGKSESKSKSDKEKDRSV